MSFQFFSHSAIKPIFVKELDFICIQATLHVQPDDIFNSIKKENCTEYFYMRRKSRQPGNPAEFGKLSVKNVFLSKCEGSKACLECPES